MSLALTLSQRFFSQVMNRINVWMIFTSFNCCQVKNGILALARLLGHVSIWHHINANIDHFNYPLSRGALCLKKKSYKQDWQSTVAFLVSIKSFKNLTKQQRVLKRSNLTEKCLEFTHSSHLDIKQMGLNAWSVSLITIIWSLAI